MRVFLIFWLMYYSHHLKNFATTVTGVFEINATVHFKNSPPLDPQNQSWQMSALSRAVQHCKINDRFCHNAGAEMSTLTQGLKGEMTSMKQIADSWAFISKTPE